MADVFGTLSMCRKAGKLILGADEVKNSLRHGEAVCVLVTRDLSPKSRKEIERLLKSTPLLELDCDMDGIGAAIGKRCGIMSVTDKGFYTSILKKLQTV